MQDDDSLAFKLLDFVCDHFGHNGAGGSGSGRTITDLIKFCEKNENKSNCRGPAILLSSLLLREKRGAYQQSPATRCFLLTIEISRFKETL